MRPHVVSGAAVLLAVTGCITAAGVSPAAQGQNPNLRTFEQLVRTVAQATAPDALQIRVSWQLDRAVANPTAAVNRLDVIDIERVTPGLSHDRRPEVSSQHIVVVSQDATGAELDWRAIVDPRVVRSESPATGDLRGETLYYLDAELVLVVPALAATDSLSLYKVVSRDGVAALSPFGRVAIPPSALR